MIIATSSTAPKDNFFYGYCFAGADYVVGDQGYTQYAKATGKEVLAGNDGCYVVGNFSNSGFSVGTDARGLYKLFLYESGSTWVLGTSLAELADYVRSRNLPLDVVRSELDVFGVRSAFNSQMTNARTIFRQIRLLPANPRVEIRSGEISWTISKAGQTPPYSNALFDYIATWRNRLATLLSDERIAIPSDLSGGLDSRVVTAFLIESGHIDSSDRRYRITSHPSLPKDYAAATAIADEFGLALNGPPPRSVTPRSGKRALTQWREQSLGVYLPLYLTPKTFDPFHFQAHGAGGENHRQYYSDANIDQRIRRYTKVLGDASSEWAGSVKASLEEPLAASPYVDPLVMHYRQYRNRFHFGHRPHVRPMFTPLNSILLNPITDRPGGVEARQVYFDIMESLVPGLALMPYDDPAKAPSDENFANLTVINDLGTPDPGRVFAEPADMDAESDDMDPYRGWLEDAARALARPDVQESIGPEAKERASAALIEASASDRALSSHHRGVLTLSYTLLTDLAFGPPK